MVLLIKSFMVKSIGFSIYIVCNIPLKELTVNNHF